MMMKGKVLMESPKLAIGSDETVVTSFKGVTEINGEISLEHPRFVSVRGEDKTAWIPIGRIIRIEAENEPAEASEIKSALKTAEHHMGILLGMLVSKQSPRDELIAVAKRFRGEIANALEEEE